VRHVVAALLMADYQAVRSYEPLLPDAPLGTYHALRIECKRLRYALEFFRELLGAEAPALIKRVTVMQDLLGDLQDATVAEQLLAHFLEQQAHRRVKQAQRAPLEGVSAYLAEQWTIQRELLERFPEPWGELIGYEFRRSLGLAVAAM
jgi:CHAD domain-containing protein